jgi:hypothetical protein
VVSSRRASVRVQLSHAIKESFHGAATADSAKSNLLRRASMLPVSEMNDAIGLDVDTDCSTLLPLIKRCVFVSEVMLFSCIFDSDSLSQRVL